jgi:hypothetical protein
MRCLERFGTRVVPQFRDATARAGAAG